MREQSNLNVDEHALYLAGVKSIAGLNELRLVTVVTRKPRRMSRVMIGQVPFTHHQVAMASTRLGVNPWAPICGLRTVGSKNDASRAIRRQDARSR